MNNTFLLWLGIAGAIGVGLLLLLGAPVTVETQEMADGVVIERGTTEIGDESGYWESVAVSAAAPAVVPAARVVYVAPSAPAGRPASACSNCGRPLSAPSCAVCNLPLAPAGRAASACSNCGTPVSAPSCATCNTSRVAPSCPGCGAQHAAFAPAAPMVGGCGLNPVAPCGHEVCARLQRTSETSCGDACGDPCQGVRPGINRNMELCVDECAFVQLHSTVPQPLCRNVHFRWSASRGSFLDSTVGAPMYYAPTTHLLGGEDVWITLTVIASDGTQYSDHISLHVNNVR